MLSVTRKHVFQLAENVPVCTLELVRIGRRKLEFLNWRPGSDCNYVAPLYALQIVDEFTERRSVQLTIFGEP